MAAGSIKAHQRYRTKSGIIVPGVTTILNLLNKPALVPWAWKLGMQGIDYRKATQQAADIGTIAHYLVECFLTKQKADLDNFTLRDIQQAQIAFSNFESWWHTHKLKVIGVENQLVSEKYRYGGTIDCVAQQLTTKRILLIDVKTSKAIYDEMRYQLAAYWHMWDEINPDKPIDEAYIIRLDKVNGSISFHALGDLSQEFEIYLHLRDIYELIGRKDPKRRTDKLYYLPFWYQLMD